MHAKKCTFVDRHDPSDLVAYVLKGITFLCKLVALRFLNASNVPTKEACSTLPDDLLCPIVIDKTNFS